MKKMTILAVLALFLISCASNAPQGEEKTVGDSNTNTIPRQIEPAPEEHTNQTAENFKEFKMTAKKFEFSPSIIEVNKGDKVRLIVTSIDIPHGISISEYGINENLPVGKPVTIEFVADKQGTFTAFCSVFCGAGHSNMKGQLIVHLFFTFENEENNHLLNRIFHSGCHSGRPFDISFWHKPGL